MSAENLDAQSEVKRLLRCIVSIEDELTRDPPRVGDALFVCEAARAGTSTEKADPFEGANKTWPNITEITRS